MTPHRDGKREPPMTPDRDADREQTPLTPDRDLAGANPYADEGVAAGVGFRFSGRFHNGSGPFCRRVTIACS